MRAGETTALWIGLAGLACAGCAGAPAPPLAIELTPSTTQVEGWLSTRGELTLFPVRKLADYDPYPQDERARCVSLIDATGQSRAALSALDGRRAVARGEAVAYEALADGKHPADQLLGRKYHGEDMVHNGCVRPYVLIARSLEAAK